MAIYRVLTKWQTLRQTFTWIKWLNSHTCQWSFVESVWLLCPFYRWGTEAEEGKCLPEDTQPASGQGRAATKQCDRPTCVWNALKTRDLKLRAVLVFAHHCLTSLGHRFMLLFFVSGCQGLSKQSTKRISDTISLSEEVVVIRKETWGKIPTWKKQRIC